MATPPLPHGYRNARVPLLIIFILGDFAQGGLVFGWNALAIMLKQQNIYTGGCNNVKSVIRENGEVLCQSQESSLAVLWTVGIFALNFGPVFVGPLLDYFGPKMLTVLGTLLNMVGLFLIAFSTSSGFNALPAGAVIIGLGGITYHLAQFHFGNLFPRKRGLISSLYVAGFTGCGIIFYILYSICGRYDCTRNAYRGTLVAYACFISLWIPINLWAMPWTALQIGQIYVMTKTGRFKAVWRNQMDRFGSQELSLTQKPTFGVGVTNGHAHVNGSVVPEDSHDAFTDIGLMPAAPNSSDPTWTASTPPGDATPTRRRPHVVQPVESPTASPHSMTDVPITDSPMQEQQLASSSSTKLQQQDEAAKQPARQSVVERNRHTASDVVWGPLIFEARRFVELRRKSLWQQVMSNESLGMGFFYTFNVFCIQFYLGTTRLQLEHKGDARHHYTDFANIIVSFGFLGIPIIGWLLDTKGYGITLGTINFLGVLCSVLEAIPSLQLQVVTLIVWAAQRFFLYTSYFAIFGALFGFANFGKMVAIDNTFNGLFGLLQLPLTYWGLHGLNGNFTLINCLQIVVLMPLFIFCYYMYRWERSDLVPIRPLEGEELPTAMVGPRIMREAKFVDTLRHMIPLEADS